MKIILIGLAVLAFIFGLLWLFILAKPSTIIRLLRLIAGILALAAAVFLGLVGKWAFAMPVGASGLYLLWLVLSRSGSEH